MSSSSSTRSVQAPRSSRNNFSQPPHFKDIPDSCPPETRPSLSSWPNSADIFNVDLSWTARSIVPIPHAIDSSLGFTTMTNLPVGVRATYNAALRGLAASQRDDNGALLEATVDGTVSGLQALFGLDYVGVRSLGVTTSFAPHLHRLAPVLAILTSIGNYLFGALYFGIGILGIVQAVRASRFYHEYKEEGGDFSSLIRCLLVSKQKIREVITHEKTTLHILGLQALKETGLSPLVLNRESPARRDQLLTRILKSHFASRPELAVLKEFYFPQVEKERAFQKLTFTESLGLLVKLEKMQATRESRAVSAIGNKCVQKIKKAALRGLKTRLKSNTPADYRVGKNHPFAPDVYGRAVRENHALLSEVESSYARYQRQNFGLVFIGVLGTIVAVLSCVLLGPTGVTALFWLNLITAASSAFLVDTSYFQDALEAPPGLHDKKVIVAYALLVSIGIALSIASLVFLGTSPFLTGFTAGLGTTMLGLYAAAYYKTHKKELRWKQDHPTLEDLSQRLDILKDNEMLSTSALNCFKKLPKALRKTLTDQAALGDFHQERYRQWNADGLFSSHFLQCYFTQSEPLGDIEVEQLYRAVKKTAKFCWGQWWYSNKNSHFEKQALLLEQLLESIAFDLALREEQAQTHEKSRKDNLEELARTSLQNAHRYLYEIQDLDVQFKLHENIFRIFKREESAFALRAAVINLFSADIT